MSDTRFDSLSATLKDTLAEWIDDLRDEGLIDLDLLEMIETAATAVLNMLPDLTIYTDGEPSGPIGDLEEAEIHRAFEDYAEYWNEMEWSHQCKVPEPGLLEEKVVEIFALLEGEAPDEDQLEEFNASLETYIDETGYSLD